MVKKKKYTIIEEERLLKREYLKILIIKENEIFNLIEDNKKGLEFLVSLRIIENLKPCSFCNYKMSLERTKPEKLIF